MGTSTLGGTRSDRWVEAAPFSALLRHLMAVSGAGPDDLAALTGLSVRLVQHLAYGRQGRPVRRVSPHVGTVLVQLQPAQITSLRTTYVPAGLARAKLELLQEAGWTEDAVMHAIGASAADQRAITRLGGRCTQLMLVRLRALCRDLEADHLLDLELQQLREAA